MIILCDVDNVVADLVTEWLRLYNNDYSDSLCPDDITEWSIEKFVHPDCGKKIYTYLTYENLYDNVSPIPGARYGIEYLRNDLGHRVVFVTSGIYCVGKFNWLEKHGFNPGEWGKDFIVANDKSLIRGNWLIDDGIHNLETFQGQRIMFAQPWNQDNPALVTRRVDTWVHICYFFGHQ